MLNDFVDQYCERTAPGLWNEPLNAVSNLAFFLAAWLLYRRFRNAARRPPETLPLIALVAIVGTGSLLFHTFATRWAEIADALPILVFISAFLLMALRRLVSPDWRVVLTLFALYHEFNYAMQAMLPPGFLNGSVFYLPTWFALVVLGLYLHLRKDSRSRAFLAAGGLLLVSLSLRSVDLALCDTLPFGLHLFWHLLNAGLLYLLVVTLCAVPSRDHVTILRQ